MLNLILIISIGSLLVLPVVLYFRYNKLKHLTGELDQQNTNLERNLAQANRKVESLFNELKEIKASSRQISEQREVHLSSENERLSRELDQELRRNLRIEKKLAASNLSLEQSDQRNEKLTGELAQANRRNVNLERDQKRLSIQLKQEHENKNKLEKELKLSGSSAYRTLLDAIYAARCIKTDEQKHTLLNNLLTVSQELGREYQQQNLSPDYSKPYYQEAYLLRYFLPYSQPVPYLLNHLTLQKNFPYQLPEDGTLKASFFGCGPGPELYGLMHYLGGPHSGIDISVAMLDIVPWEHARKIVFEHLLTRPEIREFKSNLVGSARDFLPNDSGKWISDSDLIVIQHCLNEKHNARNERLLENLKQIVWKMKPGAVMLIIERARYRDVQVLLGKFGNFCSELKDSSSIDFEAEINSRDGVDLKPVLQVIPEELKTSFFGKWSSNSVSSVKFIWMAVLKKHQL